MAGTLPDTPGIQPIAKRGIAGESPWRKGWSTRGLGNAVNVDVAESPVKLVFNTKKMPLESQLLG